jgi:hypothetical protein
MVLKRGFPIRNANPDADDLRLVLAGLVSTNTNSDVRMGILAPVGKQLYVPMDTMTLFVNDFAAAFQRDRGVIFGANDGRELVRLDVAPAADWRWDIVWVKYRDSSQTVSIPDADDVPVFGVAKGATGRFAYQATRTNVPDGALELFAVKVPAGATGTNSAGVEILEIYPYTAAAGGAIPVRSTDERNRINLPSKGQKAYRLDAEREEFWDGDDWRAAPGTILQTTPVTFDYVNADADANGVLQNFVFGLNPQPLIAAWIDDPGVPYRVQIHFHAEAGSNQAGTRWDYAVGVGNNDGAMAEALGIQVMPPGTVEFISITTIPSMSVYKGRLRVVAQAGRVYGEALGKVTRYNRQFTFVVIAA